MCKKLLVFSAAFGLGIVGLLLLNQPSRLEPTIVARSVSVSNSQPVQIIHPITEFFNDFKKAIAEDERETVASLINFPIKVGLHEDGKKSLTKTIKNKAEFLLHYERIFDDSSKKSIAQTETGKFVVSTSGVISNVKSEIVMKTFGISEMPKGHQFTKDDVKIIELNRK